MFLKYVALENTFFSTSHHFYKLKSVQLVALKVQIFQILYLRNQFYTLFAD